MAAKQHDLVVIGAGPGGYVAAIRAAQLGLTRRASRRSRRSAAPACGSAASRARRCSSRRELFAEAQEGLPAPRDQAGRRRARPGRDAEAQDRHRHARSPRGSRLFKKNKITRYAGTAGWPVRARSWSRPRTGRRRRSARSTSSSPPAAAGAAARRDLRRRPGRHQHRGAVLPRGAAAPGRDRRRRHRAGAGLGLGAARGEGHGARVPRPHPARHGRRDRGRDGEALQEAGPRVPDRRARHRRARGRRQARSWSAKAASRSRCDRVLVAVGRVPNTEGLGLESVGIATRRAGAHPGRRALRAPPRPGSSRSAT